MNQREALLLAGLALIGAGVWLRWRLSWYCSDAEEAAKDGKITTAAARRRIQWLTWGTPALTMAGLLLLIFAALP